LAFFSSFLWIYHSNVVNSQKNNARGYSGIGPGIRPGISFQRKFYLLEIQSLVSWVVRTVVPRGSEFPGCSRRFKYPVQLGGSVKMSDNVAESLPEEGNEPFMFIPENWHETTEAKAIRAELLEKFPDIEEGVIGNVIMQQLYWGGN
jgi:hypothetical protein